MLFSFNKEKSFNNLSINKRDNNKILEKYSTFLSDNHDRHLER